MIYPHFCIKKEATNTWLICPVCCKQKLVRLLSATEAKNLPLFCKRCKQEIIVNILNEPEP